MISPFVVRSRIPPFIAAVALLLGAIAVGARFRRPHPERAEAPQLHPPRLPGASQPPRAELPSQPAPVRVCTPSLPATADTVRHSFEFVEDVLLPAHQGRRIRDLRRADPTPRPSESVTALQGREHPLVMHGTDAKTVRQRINLNRGVYAACYADALSRHPGLTGRVVVGMDWDRCGLSRQVTIESSTIADPTLEACLKAAAAEVWLEPSDEGIHASWPFVLRPQTVPHQTSD